MPQTKKRIFATSAQFSTSICKAYGLFEMTQHVFGSTWWFPNNNCSTSSENNDRRQQSLRHKPNPKKSKIELKKV